MFSKLSISTLAKAAIFKNAPIYVQFFVTARCNLTCQQCNIIYSNSDVRECTLDEIKRIADNFVELDVAIVLLTGGEPFMRKDLPEIVHAFESRGIHVRMQTNGHASEEQIVKCIEAGGHDISISLDTLIPEKQDKINGGFKGSWKRAIRAISLFSKYLPKEGSFAALGCVLQPDNIHDVEDVIKFGTEIKWYTSLVPVHVASYRKPAGFRTFDNNMDFTSEHASDVMKTVKRVRQMQKEGYLLYDSDQYLDDIIRFVKKDPITWRNHNSGICDTPNLYFAILPNGHFAPCCDHRIKQSVPVYSDQFPSVYKDSQWRDSVLSIAKSCSGCMYGSYPEMTISMRFLKAKLQRMRTFFTSPPEKNWPFEYDDLISISKRIRSAGK